MRRVKITAAGISAEAELNESKTADAIFAALPITATALLDLFAPLTLVKQRLRVAGEVVDVVTPTSLSPPQAQVLARLGLFHPTTYLHPTVTPHPT